MAEQYTIGGKAQARNPFSWEGLQRGWNEFSNLPIVPGSGFAKTAAGSRATLRAGTKRAAMIDLPVPKAKMIMPPQVAKAGDDVAEASAKLAKAPSIPAAGRTGGGNFPTRLLVGGGAVAAGTVGGIVALPYFGEAVGEAAKRAGPGIGEGLGLAGGGFFGGLFGAAANAFRGIVPQRGPAAPKTPSESGVPVATFVTAALVVGGGVLVIRALRK